MKLARGATLPLSKYIFVLAHGYLSLAELIAYLESREVSFRVLGFNKKVALLSIADYNLNQIGSSLGGIYKIGTVLSSLERSRLRMRGIKVLDGTQFFDFLPEKVSWGLSVYSMQELTEDVQYIRDYFQQRVRAAGATKGKYQSATRPSQQAYPEVMSEDVTRRRMTDILVALIGSTYDFGLTEVVSDHEAYRKRDLGRPVQKPMISIPPKLARILVNLSGVKPGEILLDPFCGIGTILQEGLVMGADIRGIDLRQDMVEATQRNLDWISREFRIGLTGLDDKVTNGDAQTLRHYFHESSIDAVASEPVLLPPLKQFVSEKKAGLLLAKSRKIYARALESISSVLKRWRRVAIVAPFIRTRGGGMKSFDLKSMASKVGLMEYIPRGMPKIRWPLFPTITGDEKVIRGIFVFQKS